VVAEEVQVSEPTVVHTNDRLLSATSAAARADGDGGRQTKGRTPSVVLLLTIEEAAVALAVPRSWLRDKVTARQVPHTRLGRHVRFSQEHLRQIIGMGEEVADIGPVPTGGRRRRGRARATGSNGSAISPLPRLDDQSR
jgi:excisionase family DNA binding protein